MKLPFWPNPLGYRNIDLGLTRVYDLLARLDNPHLKLPPIIHISGTNGKGSTLAFLRAIFYENGYNLHTYTSPHLVEFNERIVINNKNISDELLNECLQACKTACELEPQISITYFEAITVAAFLAFSGVGADILLLETGMGGRLDATNAIVDNLLSIITPIGLDHTEFLGDNITKIAYEKAGIIKKNSLVIVSKQENEALEVIKNYSLNQNNRLIIFAKDWRCETGSNSWIYKPVSDYIADIHDLDCSVNKNNLPIFKMPITSLIGQHQIENASTAITAALAQNRFPLKIKSIQAALQKTVWLARLQKINSGKFYNFLGKNDLLIVDGSHNLQGSQTLVDFLKNYPDHQKIVIFAMLKDKDCFGFLNNIKNKINFLVALEIDNEEKSRTTKNILKIALDLDIKAVEADNFSDAFIKIFTSNISPKLITICGSLYQAGNFLEENEKN